MRSTPKEFLKEENARNREKNDFSREDGLIIFLLKLIFNDWIWNRLYKIWVWIALTITGTLNKPTDRPELCVRHAADAYMLFMGVVLVFCYFRLLDVARTGAGAIPPVVAAIVWCFVPVYRMIETISVTVMLHANGPYYSNAPMRAVSKMLWAYLEFVVTFASIYLAVVILTGDKFGTVDDPGFLKCWVNPLYFSMITIATVGYGDFAPQSGLGRFVVMIEVFCGLLLLVVVLQRALAVSLSNKREASTDSTVNVDRKHSR